MYYYNNNNFVSRLLLTYGSLPKNAVIQAASSMTDEQIDGDYLSFLDKNGVISFAEGGICQVCENLEVDKKNLRCLMASIPFFERAEKYKNAYKAAAPFDFLLEVDDRCLGLIDYNERGVYKLRIRRHMEKADCNEIVPVIILSEDEFKAVKTDPERDISQLLNDDEYYFAVYDPKRKNKFGLNTVRVVSMDGSKYDRKA